MSPPPAHPHPISPARPRPLPPPRPTPKPGKLRYAETVLGLTVAVVAISAGLAMLALGVARSTAWMPSTNEVSGGLLVALFAVYVLVGCLSIRSKPKTAAGRFWRDVWLMASRQHPIYRRAGIGPRYPGPPARRSPFSRRVVSAAASRGGQRARAGA